MRGVGARDAKLEVVRREQCGRDELQLERRHALQHLREGLVQLVVDLPRLWSRRERRRASGTARHAAPQMQCPSHTCLQQVTDAPRALVVLEPAVRGGEVCPVRLHEGRLAQRHGPRRGDHLVQRQQRREHAADGALPEVLPRRLLEARVPHLVPQDRDADELAREHLRLVHDGGPPQPDAPHDLHRGVAARRRRAFARDRQRVDERLRVRVADALEEAVQQRPRAGRLRVDARDELRDDLQPHLHADGARAEAALERGPHGRQLAVANHMVRRRRRSCNTYALRRVRPSAMDRKNALTAATACADTVAASTGSEAPPAGVVAGGAGGRGDEAAAGEPGCAVKAEDEVGCASDREEARARGFGGALMGGGGSGGARMGGGGGAPRVLVGAWVASRAVPGACPAVRRAAACAAPPPCCRSRSTSARRLSAWCSAAAKLTSAHACHER